MGPVNLLSRFRLTIGTKLVSLIAATLVSSLVTLVYLSTRMFIDDNTRMIQSINADTASSLATRTRELFENVTEKMRILGTVLVQDQLPEQRDAITREFFVKDKDFLAVYVHAADAGAQGGFKIVGRSVSPEMAETIGDPDGEKSIAAYNGSRAAGSAPLATIASRGESQVSAFALGDGTPAIGIVIPFIEAANKELKNPDGQPLRFSHLLMAIVRQDKFVKTFGESGVVTTFMVDSSGRLLAHPEGSRVTAGENVSDLEIVKQLLSGKFNNGQTRYIDPASKEAQLGAYRTVGFGGLGVVAEVPEAKAFEAARKVQYRATLVALIVLCISFFGGYVFSGTITWPIKQLALAANRIAQGDFKIRLSPRGRDEVAQLSITFNEMAMGLEERDRVKATFAKFHSKEMADAVLSGELKLGGERKSAAVFFSDVRGFTALSEGMDPEALVKILNRYMTRMVRVILDHGGIVDKYVGDAIMAVWGVPLSKPGDVERAIRACLGMRASLGELNAELINEGIKPLKIGMGLNFGPLISGNIGSEERMEYTVIGDTVNTASRIESLTKEFGTDLLISREVLEQVGGKFVVEKAHEAKVKGKSEPLAVYKVHGFIDESGKEVRIETPYSSYAAEKSDKVVHAPEPAKAAPARAPEIENSGFIDRTGLIDPEIIAMNTPGEAGKPSEPPTPRPDDEELTPPETTASVALPRPPPALTPPPPPPPISASAPPARLDTRQWFIKVGQEVMGPFEQLEIVAGIDEHAFPRDSLIRSGEQGPWQSLSEFAPARNDPKETKAA